VHQRIVASQLASRSRPADRTRYPSRDCWWRQCGRCSRRNHLGILFVISLHPSSVYQPCGGENTLRLIRSERHSRPITISILPILKANERTGNNKMAKRTTPPLRSPGLQSRFAELLKYSRVEDLARLLGYPRAYGELWS
jgi:hypothetical protein